MKNEKKIQGQKIKQARLDAGFTQKELSTYLAIDQSMISKVEKGDRALDLELINKISELLCIPSEYFLDDNKDIYDRQVSFRTDKLASEDLDFITTINKIVLNQISMDDIRDSHD